MKKSVVISAFLIFFVMIFLCSCTTDTSGYMYELTSQKWGAELTGGSEVALEFSSDIASLTIKSFNETAEISGKYVADNECFIIFDDDLSQAYTFYYEIRGENLDLTYDKSTITLKSF